MWRVSGAMGRGRPQCPATAARSGGANTKPDMKKAPAPAGARRLMRLGSSKARAYLILPSLYSTCLRATGSNFLIENFSVMVRAFFLVT